jgi:hypothetical protein
VDTVPIGHHHGGTPPVRIFRLHDLRICDEPDCDLLAEYFNYEDGAHCDAHAWDKRGGYSTRLADIPREREAMVGD